LGIYWNSPQIVSYISLVLNYFKIVPNIQNTNWNVYILVFYLISGMFYFICFSILIIAMLLFRSEIKKQESISGFFSGIYFLYSETQQILFIPILEYFLFIFNCQNNGQGQYIHEAFPDVVCFEGNMLVHMFISIINICLYVIIGFYNEKYIIDYRKRSSSKSKYFSLKISLLHI